MWNMKYIFYIFILYIYICIQKCIKHVMFSFTPLNNFPFILLWNYLSESDWVILYPQTLAVAVIAVQEMTYIPFCLMMRIYHFTVPFPQCMAQTLTISKIHFFFFLHREEETLCKMVGRCASFKQWYMQAVGTFLSNYYLEFFLLVTAPSLIIVVFQLNLNKGNLKVAWNSFVFSHYSTNK